jgi:hypothetical protein
MWLCYSLVAFVQTCSIRWLISSCFSWLLLHFNANNCFMCAMPVNNRSRNKLGMGKINIVHNGHSFWCLLCSFSKPNSLILFASCWAFFFRRHARDANLFFSLRVFGRTLNGNSLTGVMSLITRPNLSSSFPITFSFLALGVRSFPSPFRAFPLCFIWTDLWVIVFVRIETRIFHDSLIHIGSYGTSFNYRICFQLAKEKIWCAIHKMTRRFF